MVRNHWYKINVTAVKRIGEAVYNPNVIIPDIPEKTEDYYLAAEIHVLSWHVVNQNVEL
jgi:predicted helicase